MFRQPARFTFGNVGRNAYIGPGAVRAGLSVIKRIYLPWEGRHLQFRGEVINFPNRANFGLPNQNVQAANFGTITSLAPGGVGPDHSVGAAVRVLSKTEDNLGAPAAPPRR